MVPPPVRRRVLLERQACARCDCGQNQWHVEEMGRLAVDGDGDFVAVDARVRVHRRAGAAGGSEDSVGAVDAGLRSCRGGGAGAVLGGGFGDRAGVGVGDRFGREGDHEQDEAEREQALDQGLPALLSKSTCERPHPRRLIRRR